MKKKKLKNLNVKKSTISNLSKDALTGGTIRTHYTVCGTGPHTIACTFQAPNCGTYNSVNQCQTIEVDKNTIPIC
ncbi:hypothetical protein [Kordia sp.]|uniref:hypothetical protein n=1 Tax=Kordia sp. TaxID=1965332 RepID=UPI0025B917CD|nr:hypothetical protein [Kordia sp.]MCH2196969.1 hypothetical protein [Kordia sp.]